MTPSEKAIQMLEQYANLEYCLSDYDFRLKIEPWHKKQALICLDEILSLYKSPKRIHKTKNKCFIYWQEVKEAVEEY